MERSAPAWGLILLLVAVPLGASGPAPTDGEKPQSVGVPPQSVGVPPKSVYAFGEIIVTGERPRVVDEVTGVEVVTAADIARSGARTVDEAIALLPGVYVRRGAQGVPLIDIRGLRTRNVMLLLDGVPLNSSFDGLFDPATLSVENIARIKLTRGASSMLYGPGGNAGVLNIVTRGAGAGIETAARLEAGSTGSARAGARASWRGRRSGLVVSGSHYDRDSWELSGDFDPTGIENGDERLNSDRRDTTAFASWTFDRSPATSFGVNLNSRDGERGKPPVTEDFRQSPFAPRARFERAERRSTSLHAALSHRSGESWTLRPSIYANRGDETTDGYDDASFAGQIGAGALHEEAETTIWGTALQAARQGDGGGLLTVALDLRRESWQASGFQIVAAGGGGGGGGGGGMGGGDRTSTVDIEEDREVEQSSLALEYELAPGGRWTAVIGAGWAAQRRDEIGRDEDYSFLVGGSYELGRDLKLRGSVARRVRFPTLRDLYAADRGNPTLEPERTVDGELALERSLGLGQNLELTVFRIEADDFIERVPNDVLRNIQESRFQGVELAGRHRLDGSVRLSWSYGYLDSRNLSADGGTDKTQNRPEHKATLVGEGVTAKGWRLRGEALFVADSYALSRQRPARAMELGDYLVVGASLAVPLRGEDWRVVGRVTNLFDTAYVESIGFPAPGREFLLAFEVGRSPAGRP